MTARTDRQHMTRERRDEIRAPAAGRITWRFQGDRRLFHGLLSDGSHSSVSFITDTSPRPEGGDRIEILEPDGRARAYEVARTSLYDAQLSLVACQVAANVPRATA
jgi:hypothetical protein